MALMMVVTISSGSLSSRFSPRNPSQLAPVRDYELATLKGRSLLAVEDYDQNFDDSPADTDRAPVNGTDCRKKYFNQTESNILNDVLSSWVDRHEKLRTGHVRRVKTSTFAKSSVNATIPPSNATVPRTNASANPKTKSSTAPLGRPADSWNHLDLLSGDNIRQQQLKRTRRPSNNMRRPFDLQVYSQIEMQYMQLVRALKQRDDTIYLVSMKDYLLLPATGRNSTERPRLTLVVPALSLNGSYPNQVAMMRIECEVIGTGLLHLPETLFPSFLNQTLF
uniref:Uncharacterized protein n=1 Tax=Plectus sambesii TaxID=2011161 RepID=A0A914WGP9_9BILA